MSGHISSTAAVILAILGICWTVGFIYFISRMHDLSRGMKYRLIVRRACLILLLASGIIGIAASRGTVWERGASGSMLFFAFAYVAFPFYTLVKLLANGIRGKMARGSQPQ